MKKRFKKIYIEITNICNLACPFCPPDNREKQWMTKENFEMIIQRIKEYTDYIYLHVKGEPLLHPQVNELIEIANQAGIQVNITTNGTCFKNLINKNIRQINYSIQSTNDVKQIQKTIEEIKNFIKDTPIFLSLRLWSEASKENKELHEMIKKMFSITEELQDGQCLEKNIFLSIENEFTWPDIEEQKCTEEGYCHGIKDHIAILVDGSVVPCCLDHRAEIVLGNILENQLSEIIESERANRILIGFQNRKAVEPLCQKCQYKLKFNKTM